MNKILEKIIYELIDFIDSKQIMNQISRRVIVEVKWHNVGSLHWNPILDPMIANIEREVYSHPKFIAIK